MEEITPEMIDKINQEYFPNPHEYEHRLRAIESEGHAKRADDALAKLDRIRRALENHPKCDKYIGDDEGTCGWKRAVSDITRALED